MKVLYCTIVSKYRLHQCLAMYHSLKRLSAEMNLAILAVDNETKDVLDRLELAGAAVITPDELKEERIEGIKKERNLSEYCWTLKPLLLQHFYELMGNHEVFAYIDSDLFFFDSPDKLFPRNKPWSVLLTTHKVNRKANGGFVAFRRGAQAHKALKWWRDKCLEWCCSYYEDGRFADQVYLDSLKDMFSGVCYIEEKGANVATWNFFNYDLCEKNGKLFVDGRRLIFYHFSGLRMKRLNGSTLIYGADMPCLLCRVYTTALKNAIAEISEVCQDISNCFYSEI